MQQKRKITALCLAGALVLGNMPVTGVQAKVSGKGYTLSKNAGTYREKVTVKLKVKKGWQVYYTTGKKLSAKKKVKANKSKTFSFKKTTTLRLYAVKVSRKMSAKKIKTVKTKSMAKYRYTIYPLGSMEPTSSSTTGAGGNVSVTTASDKPVEEAKGTVAPVETSGSKESQKPETTKTPVETPGGSQYEGDDAAANYVEPVRIAMDDSDADISETGATAIVMKAGGPDKKVTETNYEISKKNKLTITAPGTYVISAAEGVDVVDGLIEVDYADTAPAGTAHLILKGIAMTSSNNTEPTSDTGLITIKSNVTRAIITLAGGTVNTLTDTGATGMDKDDGVSTTYTGGIVCKKTPLTINGTGTLHIVSTNGNGIKCTDSMKIADAGIHVSGPSEAAVGHNGITAKLDMGLKNAKISVHSNGDALKTTLDKGDIEKDDALAERGNMEIDGGEYTLVSENGDGISVYRTLYLNPEKMSVTTKNAAGSTAEGSYKGIKAGTTIYTADTAGDITVDTTATYNASRAGWDSNDSAADDTIHSNGYIKIDGGNFILKAGDDGIHSDNGLVINRGNIDVEAYEGLESGDISINGGIIRLKTRDDGMNAAGGNDGITASGPGRPGDWFGEKEGNYQIIIRGGDIYVNAEGDGIDSNGNIFFQGGKVVVDGPVGSGNGALDYGDRNAVCEISGGTLIAAGSVGMDVAPTGGSSQPAVNVRFSQGQTGGTYVVLRDSEEKTVIQAQPAKQFQSIVLSAEELKLGSTYTVYYGKDLNALTKGDSVTFTSVNMTTGSASSGGWRPGGPGGRFPR